MLRAGDFALYDCTRPYTIEGAEGFRMLVCMLPRAMLGFEPGRVARMTATRIPGDDGIAVPSRRSWSGSPTSRSVAKGCGERHDRVVESVLELVESLCASVVDGDGALLGLLRGPASCCARASTPQAHSATRRWRPGEIAAAVHVSKRYLHRLFEARRHHCLGLDPASGGWRRCQRDLADPFRRSETVTSIGVSPWGLANPAHLSRLFRGAYGVSPSEYRAERLRRDEARASCADAQWPCTQVTAAGGGGGDAVDGAPLP